MAYRSCIAPLHQDIENLQEIIAEAGYNLLIVDSIGMAAGGEINEAQTAIQLFYALRKLKVTSLLIGHEPKDRNNKSIIGSAFFGNTARQVWHTKKAQDKDADDMDLLLENTKPPSFLKQHADLAFHIKFSDRVTVITKTDARVFETSNRNRILDCLIEQGELTTAMVSTYTGIHRGTVASSITRLRSDGLVVSGIARHTHKLTPEGNIQ